MTTAALGETEKRVLYRSRCELLQQGWSKGPSVWEEGRSVVRAPVALGEGVPTTLTSKEPRLLPD